MSPSRRRNWGCAAMGRGRVVRFGLRSGEWIGRAAGLWTVRRKPGRSRLGSASSVEQNRWAIFNLCLRNQLEISAMLLRDTEEAEFGKAHPDPLLSLNQAVAVCCSSPFEKDS